MSIDKKKEMHFFKTVDDNGFVRIEEDCGAAITLYLHNDTANIISIVVPESDRGEGIGSALMSVAEGEVYSRGINKVEADYKSDILGISNLLMFMGYNVSENASVCAVDIDSIFASTSVKKILKKDLQGVRFCSLEELVMNQWDVLLNRMSKLSVRISASDMALFSQSLSGVVYDENGLPQALILCTEAEESIHVDYLVSWEKENNKYVIAVLQGILKTVYSLGGVKKYHRITAFCAHENISKLIDITSSQKPEVIGMAMYAVKELGEGVETNIELDKFLDEYMKVEWRKEILKVPFQANIEWKTAWYRERMMKTKH